MKIYNWIDFFLSKKEYRKRFLSLILILYWIWQILWQILAYTQLIHLKDYQSLLSYANQLNLYTGSVLFRILLTFISHKSFTFDIFLKITLWDYIILFLTILYSLSFKSKNAYICIKLYISTFFVSIISVIVAYLQQSLNGVIFVLKGMGIACSILCIILFLFLLACLIETINAYRKEIDVHNM